MKIHLQQSTLKLTLCSLFILITVNRVDCCMQKRRFAYCDTTLSFQKKDFIDSWSKFEGRLDINSSKKLFFDVTTGKKVIFSTAICNKGAETVDEAGCETLTAAQVERLKKAVQIYTNIEEMKQKAYDVKIQAGTPRIRGPYGDEFRSEEHTSELQSQ